MADSYAAPNTPARDAFTSTSNGQHTIYSANEFSPAYPSASSVVPASYQQPTTEEIPTGLFQANSAATPSTGSAPGPQSHQPPQGFSQGFSPAFSPTARYLNQTSNTETINLLANSANEIANSKPFQLKLELWGNVFQQQIAASGNYFQMGQGSHKTKIELSFDQTPGKPQMLQLCDGRFVYTVHSSLAETNTEEANGTKTQQKLEFVDLLRVKEATGDQATNQRIVSPTGWVATGGIASLLRHVASGFNFGPPEALDPSSDRILIRGSWDEAELRKLVSDLDNNIQLGSPIEWAKVPRHIPHAIEMTLVRGLNQTYFPHQISYFRFNVKDHQATIEPSVSMTFSAPQPLSNLADGFFVLNTSKFEPTDTTDRYIARLKSFSRVQEKIATQQNPAADSLTK